MKTQTKGLRDAPTGARSPPTHAAPSKQTGASNSMRPPKNTLGTAHPQDRRDSQSTGRRRKPRRNSASAAHVSIAERIRRLVNLNPQIRLGLASGLVNHSELARQFAQELGLSKNSFHAVLSAVKRLAAGLEKPAFEEEAKAVVARSTISLKTDIAVVRVFPNSPLEKFRSQLKIFHSVQGTAAVSLIAAADGLEDFARKNKEHVLEIRKDLTEITLVSPKEIVSTPGVLLSFLSPLYSNGINAEEVLSSHNDTIFLFSTADADRAFAVLNQIISDARK